MPQNFLFPQRDQPLLMPVDMCEWLPEDDLVFIVLDAVAALGLGEFRRRYRADGHGTGGVRPGDDGRAAAVRVLPGRALRPGKRSLDGYQLVSLQRMALAASPGQYYCGRPRPS